MLEVTILVITHRKGDLLRRCLEAVCSQYNSATDEVLVIDDGGDDQPIATQFPVRYLAVPHRGYRLASLINLGVCAATKPYIVRLDGDCVPRPGWLAAHKELAVPGKLVAGRIDWEIEPGGEITPDWRFDSTGKISSRARESNGQYFLPHRVWGGNCAFFREDLLELGGFRTEFDGCWGGEESDIGWRYYYAGREIEFCGAAGVVHLHHLGNREGAARNRRLLDGFKSGYVQGEFPPRLEPPHIVAFVPHLGLRPPEDTLFPCLEQLTAQTWPVTQVEVLVQEPQPGTVEKVNEILDDIPHHVHCEPKNRGLGWPKAWVCDRLEEADWLLFLDDDIMLPEEGIAALVGALWGTDYACAVLATPGLWYGDLDIEGQNCRLSRGEPEGPFAEAMYAGLGCSLWPSEGWKIVNFDPNYFVGGIDLDVCLQLLQADRRLVVIRWLTAEHRRVQTPAYSSARWGKVKEAWTRIETKWGLKVSW